VTELPNQPVASVVASAIRGALSRLDWIDEGPLPHEEAEAVRSLRLDLEHWLEW
jgi:hypothetical protein